MESETRIKLLERVQRFKMVPGHGPDYDMMTDQQLEFWANMVESMFEEAFKGRGDKR